MAINTSQFVGDGGVRLDGGAASLVTNSDSYEDGLVGVTALHGGGFVVHWIVDGDGDGVADGLAVQRFAADGAKQGEVTVLQGISADLLRLPESDNDASYDLQALDNGGYVLTYALQGEEGGQSATVTATAPDQALFVQIVGRPTGFYVGSLPANATFSLSGPDNNGNLATVALTPENGYIRITRDILDQFGNDNRLNLVVSGLNQGESAFVGINTQQEVRYDPAAAFDTVTTSFTVQANGVGIIATGEGRPEAFHIDSASYANGTGPALCSCRSRPLPAGSI